MPKNKELRYDNKYFEEKDLFSLPYTEKREVIRSLFLNNADRIAEMFNFDVKNGHPKRALDIGCAYGYVISVKRIRYETYGIDVSKYAIKKAKESLNNELILVVCDAQKSLPFKVKFDLITCFEVLEHLKNPDLAYEYGQRGVDLIKTRFNYNVSAKILYDLLERMKNK